MITGEGECILQVNGSQMKANVGQNLVIDTDRLMAAERWKIDEHICVWRLCRTTSFTGRNTRVYLKRI